jgi:hypothetical protein
MLRLVRSIHFNLMFHWSWYETLMNITSPLSVRFHDSIDMDRAESLRQSVVGKVH